YQIIEEYKKSYDEVSDKLKALNSTRRFDLLPYGKITTKTQYKQNEKSIAQLQKDLENLSQNQTDEYFELDREKAEKGGLIDGEISTLTRKRSRLDRKSTRLNSSHVSISYAVFCLKKTK